MDDNSNLEKYFRQQFSQNIPQETWNTPDEKVWSNISHELDKNPKRKNSLLFLPWLITGLTLFSAIYMWINNRDQIAKINDLEKRIEKCSSVSKINDNHTSQEIIHTVSKKDSPPKTVKSMSQLNPALLASTNSLFQTSHRVSKNAVRLMSQHQGSVTDELSKTELSNQSLSYDINEHVDVNEEKQATRLYEEIRILSNRKSTLFFSSNIVLPPDFTTIKEDSKKLKHPFYIGTTLRSNQWNDKSSGSFDNPLSELLTSEKTNTSISYGIQTSYTINNHLTANLSVFYNQRNQRSSYLLHIPYTTNTELLNASGEYTNSFQHSLPTGLGNVQTDLLLSRSQTSTISENEIIDLDFSFNNSVTSILAPISLSYFPKQSNDGFFINAGLQSEFVINDKVSDIKSLSHHTFVKDKQVNVNFESSQINKFNISAIAGLGYQKKIWNNLDLMASAQYGYALTNTYATESYKHKLNNLSFNISLVHKFGSN